MDAKGNAYPDDVDVSGTGFVYYVTTGPDLSADVQANATQPMDASAYHEWLRTCLGSAKQCSIPYQTLTAEHVAEIG